MSDAAADPPANAGGGAGAARRRRRWPGLAAKWTLRALAALAVALGLLAMPLACTTRIIPPVVEGDAVEVMLIDHGRTPSLVLPRSDGGHDRWVYGDFGWYAQGRTGLFRGIVVLFLPTQGGLGRQEFDARWDLQSIARARGGEARYIFTVAAEDAFGLQARLEGQFEAQRHTLVEQSGGPMMFVHDPASYTYFHNSNHRTAAWLRELGCETRGPAFSSRWRLSPPGGDR